MDEKVNVSANNRFTASPEIQDEDMMFCSKAFGAEIERLEDEDEPCRNAEN